MDTAFFIATLCEMDANAVRAADRTVLVEYAAAVAGNARDLLADAEFLLEAGRWARSYSLAVLASEEWAKAQSILTLSFMSPEIRAEVPVRGFLEAHKLKNMGALLLCLVDAGQPGVAERVAEMTELADDLRDAERRASEANTAKQRGLYADLLADGTLAVPSGIGEQDAAAAVAFAREVGAAAAGLDDPDALVAYANLSPEAVALSNAVFGSWLDAGNVNDADAAADMVRDVARLIASTTLPEVGLAGQGRRRLP